VALRVGPTKEGVAAVDGRGMSAQVESQISRLVGMGLKLVLKRVPLSTVTDHLVKEAVLSEETMLELAKVGLGAFIAEQAKALAGESRA
jgi:hypothetical protein